jgi:hypothetical protein
MHMVGSAINGSAGRRTAFCGFSKLGKVGGLVWCATENNSF